MLSSHRANLFRLCLPFHTDEFIATAISLERLPNHWHYDLSDSAKPNWELFIALEKNFGVWCVSDYGLWVRKFTKRVFFLCTSQPRPISSSYINGKLR